MFGVSLGGFDTHAAEPNQHARLMGVLDGALTSFLNAMEASPNGQKVTVVVYSEFGRRVAANASNGTDHGTASPVLVLGPEPLVLSNGSYDSSHWPACALQS